MITNFKIFEGRKKILYDKKYINWLLRYDPNFNTNKGILDLIKKYIRWKYDISKVGSISFRWDSHNDIDGKICIDYGIPNSSAYNRILIENEQEFIDFLNDPDYIMNVNKYNL